MIAPKQITGRFEQPQFGEGKDMASIFVTTGGESIEFALDAETTPVGRHPDNTIQILDGTVSGRHARILKKDHGFFLEDCGSRNGTTINDQAVAEATKLSHGDRIEFGDATAHFHDPASMPAADNLALQDPVTDRSNQAVSATIDLTDAARDTSTIAGSLENRGRFGALDVKPEMKLKTVLDISSSLAGTLDLESLLPKILDQLFDIFKYADRGCILLKDEESGEILPRAFKHRRAEEDATVRLSRTIVNRVLTEKMGVLSADASTDDQFQGSESISELKIRSMMCVPLLGLDGEPTGIISIDSTNPLGQFTTDDLELLVTVAGQAALSYETARLLVSYVAKQKQDNEMQIAKAIQRSLLPEKLPTVDGYEFCATYESAQAVGGDYYDCFVLPEGKIVVSFGDVAGKGVPGALIMSRMHSCVQSTLREIQEVEPAILAINSHMCDSAVEGRFVTYVLCLIDTVNHTIQLSNAGHMAPIIRKADGTIHRFDENELVGPPIAVMDDYPYEVETATLDPGDVFVVVTDGVDEAMNPAGDLFGVERTVATVQGAPAHAEGVCAAILANVRRHANGRPQNDDITIFAMQRKAE